MQAHIFIKRHPDAKLFVYKMTYLNKIVFYRIKGYILMTLSHISINQSTASVLHSL